MNVIRDSHHEEMITPNELGSNLERSLKNEGATLSWESFWKDVGDLFVILEAVLRVGGKRRVL